MKRFRLYLVALALVLYAASYASAQHGQGSGMNMGGNHPTRQGHETSGSATQGMHGATPGEILAHNERLATKLQTLLPSGTNLQQAAQGFKNLGQFVAAVHVSHNLGIPFDALKGKIVGPPTESLGKAIQQLRPEINAKSESKKASQQAKQDIRNAQAG